MPPLIKSGGGGGDGFFFREKIIDGYFVKYKYTLRFLRENMFEIAGNY